MELKSRKASKTKPKVLTTKIGTKSKRPSPNWLALVWSLMVAWQVWSHTFETNLGVSGFFCAKRRDKESIIVYSQKAEENTHTHAYMNIHTQQQETRTTKEQCRT